MPQVVIIDPNEAERRRLAAALAAAGFTTSQAPGSVAGLLEVLDSGPDLIVLAEEVPPLQAGDLGTILRRISNAPIIVIGSGGDAEEAEALEALADSYVRRGSSARLLMARAAALVRRYGTEGNAVASMMPFLMPSFLTPSERRLLNFFCSRPGRPASIEEIRVEALGGNVSSQTVKYHLRHLRRRLEAEPSSVSLVCLRGVGYRLEAAEPYVSVRRGDSEAGALSLEGVATGRIV